MRRNPFPVPGIKFEKVPGAWTNRAEATGVCLKENFSNQCNSRAQHGPKKSPQGKHLRQTGTYVNGLSFLVSPASPDSTFGGQSFTSQPPIALAAVARPGTGKEKTSLLNLHLRQQTILSEPCPEDGKRFSRRHEDTIKRPTGLWLDERPGHHYLLLFSSATNSCSTFLASPNTSQVLGYSNNSFLTPAKPAPRPRLIT